MGYIPPNAKWYLADIVEHITVEGDPRSVVHINTLLIRADSPEEAYEKALELGEAAAGRSYENSDGKRVEFRFRGLCDLNVIHDELEHGAEISYSEKIGLNESEIEALLTSREELGVFAPRTPSKGPDYASGKIMRKVWEAMELDEDEDKEN